MKILYLDVHLYEYCISGGAITHANINWGMTGWAVEIDLEVIVDTCKEVLEVYGRSWWG